MNKVFFSWILIAVSLNERLSRFRRMCLNEKSRKAQIIMPLRALPGLMAIVLPQNPDNKFFNFKFC